ncbi:MAG TPA: cobalamin-dependent protein [Pseudonocardiaceae bacterium]|nr:cobalamin-dependent protein [Pseudonocardiaceae bacterium]
MQQPRITAADVERFVDALARRDRKAAAGQALGLLEAGAPVQELVQGLLGAAQAEVGRRWEANQWSVADEHAATAITDAVLGALAWRIKAPEDQGHVVVTCAEGEWHSLPARMAAEVLRAHGWQVTFLGASTPADHLRRFVAEVGAVAVVVSCSVPIFLGGALRSVQAAQSEGIPVLVGGRAFGPDDTRAHRLGADGWAPDPVAAARLLESWRQQRPAVGKRPAGMRDAEPLELEAVRPDLVEAAMGELFLRFPPLAGYGKAQLARTREDLGYILQFLEAALLTDDPRIFLDEFLPWLTRVLTSRGLPAGVVTVGLEALGAVLDAFPRSQQLIAQGRRLAAGRAVNG